MNNNPLIEDIDYRMMSERRRISENIDQIRKDAHSILLCQERVCESMFVYLADLKKKYGHNESKCEIAKK